MPDDLDTLLRATMKTLDDQVPSGYFEALPEQTLARLAGEEADMQTTPRETSSSTPGFGVNPPPSISGTPVPPINAADPAVGAPKKRDDDSGLHDIRNLAQSTKQRLSSRRSSTHPPMSDEDILATTSASWKNLALPQPAKMVSLPEISELPSKHEVLLSDKEARVAAKAEAKAAKARG